VTLNFLKARHVVEVPRQRLTPEAVHGT
jgi:hypothetical protein